MCKLIPNSNCKIIIQEALDKKNSDGVNNPGSVRSIGWIKWIIQFKNQTSKPSLLGWSD